MSLRQELIQFVFWKSGLKLNFVFKLQNLTADNEVHILNNEQNTSQAKIYYIILVYLEF